MSIGDVKATIREGIDANEQAKRAIQDAGSQGHSAHALAKATAHDSQHEAIKRGLECISEAERQVEQVLRRIKVSTDAANRYLGILG